MKITSHLLEAYLQCPTKCWLRAAAEQTTDSTPVPCTQALIDSYVAAGIRRLLSTTHESECLISPPADSFDKATWRLSTGVVARTSEFESYLHAVECLPSKGQIGKFPRFIPIRFVPANKLGKDAKLLLAFDALALSKMIKHEVQLGKIVHGDTDKILSVKTPTVELELRQHIAKIGELLSRPSPPSLILIPHCAECEFQTRCRQRALENDELTLLSGMTEKERNKLHEKGIFTVTQLSYTFRPRRKSKRASDKREKYHHSLRALAIRQKKIHIVGTPKLALTGTPVYLDVEGLPDRDSYYLIGVRLGDRDPAVQYSFWADSIGDERRIWDEFLGVLVNVKDPVLIHYGGYETVFLRRMVARYGIPSEPVVARAIKQSVNLLSVIFAQVYFPTFSNSLKDIGHFLGAKWDGAVTSGLQSIAYRLEWETSAAPELKAALVAYNRNDCAAIETVTASLTQIIREAEARTDVEFSDKPKKVTSGKGAEIHGFFEALLRSAHFRYVRSRIKLSTEKATQSLPPEKEKAKKRQQRRSFSTIRGIIVRVARKRICPAGHKLSASSKISQHSLLDLRFTKSGCHKTIVRYTGVMGYCKLCHERYAPPGTRCHRGQRFGWQFQAWVVYQRVALRMSYRLISKGIYDLFSELLAPGTAIGFVEKFSEYYQRTEDLLLRELLDGRVVHVDETKINILGKDQYVWVLTDNRRVVFRLQPSRETEFLKPLFSTFKGTIVTDFYGGYDALPCTQQKCLVHLIRDLNDDLWKNPFDDELEEFVAAVRDLLVPILEDVQRFGLKARHLHKHRIRVDRFYRDMIRGQASRRDTTARYRKRFERYKESLFSFIENDGVPWHNNAAERALRHLAVQRKISGTFSEKGARDYLRLLAIAQTCRFQQKSFLGFLLSKSTNVDEYRDRSRAHPDWTTNPWEKE